MNQTEDNIFYAERAVLGALLHDNTTWDDIGDYLQTEDFSLHLHQEIYRTIRDLITKNETADIICVSQHLKTEKSEKNDGAFIELCEIAKSHFTTGSIKSYAEIVKQNSIDRKILQAAQDMIFNVEQQKENRLDHAQQKLQEIAEQVPHNITLATDILSDIISTINDRAQQQKEITGLSTGFLELDKITHGLHGGELIILAGRPSMGKTLLAMNIAEHASIIHKHSVAIFSLEMRSQELIERSFVSITKIDASLMQSGKLSQDDFKKISEALVLFHGSKLSVDDRACISASDIRAACRRIKREHGLNLVVVDYITLMGGEGENETIRISNISRSLKLLARDLNIPVIAISQLNRSVEQRTDKHPCMADLRQSGAIEQDADLILFIYRDEFYHKHTLRKGIAELIIAKHRNGSLGTINLTFNGKYCRFDNYTPSPIISDQAFKNQRQQFVY